jgi:hypothetical protein
MILQTHRETHSSAFFIPSLSPFLPPRLNHSPVFLPPPLPSPATPLLGPQHASTLDEHTSELRHSPAYPQLKNAEPVTPTSYPQPNTHTSPSHQVISGPSTQRDHTPQSPFSLLRTQILWPVKCAESHTPPIQSNTRSQQISLTNSALQPRATPPALRGKSHTTPHQPRLKPQTSPCLRNSPLSMQAPKSRHRHPAPSTQARHTGTLQT